MNSKLIQYLTTALTASAFAMGAQITTAQDNQAPQAQQQQQQHQQQQTSIDDETVSNFVDAYSDIREIHNEYAQRLQNAQDVEQATNLQQEAQAKMEEAITNSDITLEQYQRIAQQIPQDISLRNRIEAELQREQES